MDAPPTGEQVLDEVAFLGRVEHALVAEFLLIRAAIGAGVDTIVGTGPHAAAVTKAAEEAERLAVRAMRSFKAANEVLVAASRPPEVGRAPAIATAHGEIRLAALTANQFDGFPRREEAIAAAVDGRYTRLHETVSGEAPVAGLDPDVAAAISFRLSGDYTGRLPDFADHLRALPVPAYLHVTRTAPATDAERRLLAASDAHYRAIVAAVAAGVGNPTELGGLLQDQAVTTMLTLDAYNRHLVEARLLPTFTL